MLKIKHYKLTDGTTITPDEVKDTIAEVLYSQDIRELRRLVGLGLSANVHDYSLATPLMYACWYGTLDDVQFFVSKGADVNAKDMEGDDIYYYAMFNKTERNTFEFFEYIKGLLNTNVII